MGGNRGAKTFALGGMYLRLIEQASDVSKIKLPVIVYVSSLNTGSCTLNDILKNVIFPLLKELY